MNSPPGSTTRAAISVASRIAPVWCSTPQDYHREAAEALGREVEHAELAHLGGRARRVAVQHRARGGDRRRIDVEREHVRRAEQRCGHRVQAGATTEIEEALAGERVRTEQADEPILRLIDAPLVDQAGIARPVLAEREVGGDVFQRGFRVRHLIPASGGGSQDL
jgi:hypothetical protein